jgi:hypothetical protein
MNVTNFRERTLENWLKDNQLVVYKKHCIVLLHGQYVIEIIKEIWLKKMRSWKKWV